VNRIFNIAGPCDPKKHYMINPLRGLGKEIFNLIEQEDYFIIHSARQSGKTTLLLELTKQINEKNKYYAVYCSLETLQGVSEAKEGIPLIIETLEIAFMDYKLPGAESFSSNVENFKYANALQMALTNFCKELNRPLILFFDEADCLSNETLISFLRQLRSGYIKRINIPFVHSLSLVGMRNIRDYRNEYRQPHETLGSASPFNITAATMTLQNFTRNEVCELYNQYTLETGQKFDESAIDLVWEQTQGQPWLVNAIAREIITTESDPQIMISVDLVKTAIQTLVQRRDTHFDSLLARLHEDRVRQVIEPIIIGKEAAIRRYSDNYSYVKDLGLIRDDLGKTEFANPIYTEIIIRSLNWDTQKEIEETDTKYQIPRYLKDNIIDIDYLLKDFQVFWRENSEIWQKRFDYQEAAPQLVLQAFLQRVLNGGGNIIREMAAGTGRADLCVIYLNKKYPIELKIRYNENTYDIGVEQILRYMDVLGSDKGWLVMFDHRSLITWDKRLFCKEEIIGDKTVTVFGC